MARKQSQQPPEPKAEKPKVPGAYRAGEKFDARKKAKK